jgi:hypothetical protein
MRQHTKAPSDSFATQPRGPRMGIKSQSDREIYLNNGSKLTRRLFAAAVAGSPAAFAQQQPAAPASQAAPAAPAAQAPPPPPPRRRPQPPEPLPFAETLTFARKDAEVRTTPYPLSQVRLLSGPCLKAADSNRAYLMRIAPDRLLHTFRLNAGLPPPHSLSADGRSPAESCAAIRRDTTSPRALCGPPQPEIGR